MKYLSYVLVMFLGVVGWTMGASALTLADMEEPLFVLIDGAIDLPDNSIDNSSQQPPTPPIVGPTTIVTSPQFFSLTAPFGLLGRSETAIAATDDGKFIIEGWNDADGFIDPTQSLSGFGFSVNRGNTFADGGSLPSGTFGGQPVVALGDPWLATLKSGGQPTFLYASLGLRPDLATEVGITVHRGAIKKGALTWSSPTIIPAPNLATDFLDKESIAVDRDEDEQDGQAVYVTTTNFTAVGSQIELYRSFDGAATFSGPTVVKAPDPAGQQGSQVAVGPNGEVYVAWERGRFSATPEILFRASTDRGATFGPIVTLAGITGLSLFPPVGYNRSRYNDFPRVAVDRTGNHRGRVYVVYHDAGSNPNVHTNGIFFNPTTLATIPTGGVRDGDIFLKFSDDMGATFSSPTLVSSPAPGDGNVQFWPVVSVEPDGSVDVTYHQDTEVQSNPVNPLATNISIDARFAGFTRRRSSFQSLVDVYAARSTDGGATFGSPVRVNDVASNWSIAATNVRPNFGDYITSVSITNQVLCSWAQSRLYDIDPGPGVNNRFVASAAFAMVDYNPEDQQMPNTAPLAERQIPASFSLSQNYPNPFNPRTIIMYDLPKGRNVNLNVYNALGERVAMVVDGYREAGHHVASFDARNLSSGTYFYKIFAGEFSETGKMVLAK